MQIECRFYGSFREAIGEKRTVYETDAATVGELLHELEATNPTLEGRLISDNGFGSSTVVTKGKKDVRHLDGITTELAEGDIIRLTPAVYGG